MSTKERAVKPRRTETKTNGDLRVRMYRVGFGDFFLLTVPTTAGDRYILIDCGVHSGRTGKGDIGTIEDAVEDLFKTTGGKLSLVIMTHRHADHIAGFARVERFKDFEAEMVWMPYWEKAGKGRTSAKLQADVTDLANRLMMQFGSRTDEAGRAALDQLRNATGTEVLRADGTRVGSNDLALAVLRDHLGKNGTNVRYYAAHDLPEIPKGLEGLTAEILGPPGKDAETFLHLEEFKKGVGQYLDSTSGCEESGHAVGIAPFAASAVAKVDEDGVPAGYPKENAFDGKYWRPDDSVSYAQVRRMVGDVQPDMLISAAAKIEKFLNNQSLVVLFNFRGRSLLFVGDAQAGNWERWLYDVKKPVSDPAKAGPFVPQSEQILHAVDFYKVGHHGSTNATPIPVVAELGKDEKAPAVAMCSTQPGTYGNRDKDTEVPRVPLMDAIGAQCVLVRSDAFDVKLGAKTVKATTGTALPKPRSGTLLQRGLYVEYSFPRA